jgi:hypothetical protein
MSRSRKPVRVFLAISVALCASPATAEGHGPVAPAATSYLARVGKVPGGIDAKVVDGYLRMWLRVPPSETLVVLDYRGAPYLRFSRAGVYVNESSVMFYLNETPLAGVPPAGLSRSTPSRWRRVGTGHEYEWHDGRIGALSATALAPGASYVGKWSISVLLDGHLSAIAGGLWHAQSPSLVWFWLIFVLIACVLAAWRLPRGELHLRLTRALAIVVLFAIAAAGAGRELHGRPDVSIEQLAIVTAVFAFTAWGGARVLLDRAGFVFGLITGFVALWLGFELLATLLHGFVLTAVPPLVARSATVLCLGGGFGLVLLAARQAFEEPAREGYVPGG